MRLQPLALLTIRHRFCKVDYNANAEDRNRNDLTLAQSRTQPALFRLTFQKDPNRSSLIASPTRRSQTL